MPKILLVEDNLMNRDMLSRRLERRGFDVVLAAEGEEALRQAQGERPDLVVLDMGLPGLDGYEVAKRLRAAPATARIPLLGLSAHAMAGDAQRALNAGCDDYDTKPVDFSRLAAKIDALLAARSAGATPGGAAPVPPATAPRAPAAEPVARLPVGRVLVASDQPLHRDAIVRRLQSLGIEPAVANDADDLRQRLAGGRFDVLLVARGLAVAGQGEALALASELGQRGDAALLLLIDGEPAELVQRMLRLGAQDFVPTPFPPELLRARLGPLLASRRAAEQAMAASAEATRVREHADRALRRLVPAPTLAALAARAAGGHGDATWPRRLDVTLLLAEIVDFDRLCDHGSPQATLDLLNRVFATWESALASHQLDRLYTTGATMVAVGGLREHVPAAAVHCALTMRRAVAEVAPTLTARLGLHRGPLVAGLVGASSSLFDVWGTTVREGHALLRSADPGQILVSGQLRSTLDGSVELQAVTRMAGTGAYQVL